MDCKRKRIAMEHVVLRCEQQPCPPPPYSAVLIKERRVFSPVLFCCFYYQKSEGDYTTLSLFLSLFFLPIYTIWAIEKN